MHRFGKDRRMTIRRLTIMNLVVAIAILFLIGGCKESKPETTVPTSPAEKATEVVAAASVEQTVCPVMGGAIDKELFVEYKGKKVYFCCPGCEPEFEKNPEKYLAKLPQFQE
jgi:YHS domain-containing protein